MCRQGAGVVVIGRPIERAVWRKKTRPPEVEFGVGTLILSYLGPKAGIFDVVQTPKAHSDLVKGPKASGDVCEVPLNRFIV